MGERGKDSTRWPNCCPTKGPIGTRMASSPSVKTTQKEHKPETRRMRQGLTSLIDMNGTLAYTCWDTGTELDCISPDFIRAIGVETVPKKVVLLRLEYFSDIPRTSSRTPDVQLRVIDATLCIIGHLAPNLGEYPNVFLFCYNSNISLISCGCPTLCNGHGVFALLDNSCPTRPSGPMVSPFVTIQIFL